MEREPKVGECVVVARNSGNHPLQIGDRLIVSHVDDDGTIKGIPRGSKSVADYWIPFSDLEPVRFGWDFVRRHLPGDLVTLLGACDFVEYLVLSREVKESLVDQLPAHEWKDRVMAAIEKEEFAAEDDDEDLDDD